MFTRDNGIIPDVTMNTKPNSFTYIDFTYEDVFNAIRKLKSKNTVGPDSFSTAFIKKQASGISIAFPLLLIFSQFFQCAKIPDLWKTVVVTSVLKKGLSCDVNKL